MAWHELPAHEPPDLEPCWIQLNRWFSPPFIANWSASYHSWVIATFDGVYLSWNFAPRWRYVTEPPP
jgi:hypothetical protein